MATARTALEGLLAQVTPGGGWGSTLAGIGWPGQQLIQSVAQGASLVAVFDAGDGAKNATRWAGTTIGINDALPAAPGLLAAVSATALQPSGSITVTLSGSPNVNDAVVFSAQPVSFGSAAALANAVTGSGSTLSTLATALAASITASGLGLSASATGAVVTVTASSTTPICAVAANTGNQGTRTFETKRMARHVRCIVWAQTEALRESIGNPIDTQIGVLDDRGGFYLSPASPGPLGDWVHVHSDGDMLIEEQLADIYRWDFRVVLEYGTLNTETLYPVLGTSFQFTGGPTLPGTL